MKKVYYLALLIITTSCNDKIDDVTYKDLAQTMHDVRVYQDNLVEAVKKKNFEDAKWLVAGEDSVLQVMANTFVEHHIMSRPFKYYYDKDLEAPLQKIKKAVDQKDSATAFQNLEILVNRCNNCHRDYDVIKEVGL